MLSGALALLEEGFFFFSLYLLCFALVVPFNKTDKTVETMSRV